MIERFPKSNADKVELVKESPAETPDARNAELRDEAELQALLEDPANRFLTEIPANRDYIENSKPKDALAYAWNKIEARLQRTFRFDHANSLDGIIPDRVSYRGMNHAVEAVLQNAREIGRGGDAFVVINKNEIKNLPPEICYKFAIAEKTPRGRNETFTEMKMQDEFYQVAQEHSGRIGVPMPFYAVEIASHKVLAMEKLNAASIDDILGGKALLPEWIDVDELYNELKSMVGSFHDKGLFHRDMHFGNIMISQSRDAQNAEKLGYIIDFGLSAHASEEMEPYRKESAGSTFTYNNDYVILEEARIQLNALRRRNI